MPSLIAFAKASPTISAITSLSKMLFSNACATVVAIMVVISVRVSKSSVIWLNVWLSLSNSSTRSFMLVAPPEPDGNVVVLAVVVVVVVVVFEVVTTLVVASVVTVAGWVVVVGAFVVVLVVSGIE